MTFQIRSAGSTRISNRDSRAVPFFQPRLMRTPVPKNNFFSPDKIHRKEACPEFTKQEIDRSKLVTPDITEKTPGKEWLIAGFPIGQVSFDSSLADRLVRNLSHFLFAVGHRFIQFGIEDKLIVKGYADCFDKPAKNQKIKRGRADFISAAINKQVRNGMFSETIISADDEYVSSNSSESGRTRNRSVLITKAPPVPVKISGFPYDPNYGPTRENCLPYLFGESFLGKTYPANAYDACTVTPNDPNNNCVRKCLQKKYFDFLYDFKDDLLFGKKIVVWCPSIWQHHVDCYRDCGCERSFIDYLGFYPLCEYRSTPALSNFAINAFNRCNRAK